MRPDDTLLAIAAVTGLSTCDRRLRQHPAKNATRADQYQRGEGGVSQSSVLVNSGKRLFKSEAAEARRRWREGLRPIVAEAVSGRPAKEIAAELGVAVSHVYELRTGLRLPHVDIFLAIQRMRPDLAAKIEAVLSGRAEDTAPRAMNDLLRSLG